MKYKDYYETLGVSKDSDEKQIKQAYRKLAKKYHPDLNQGDEKAAEKLKEINEAYEVLSDKDKRSKYDRFGSNYDFSGGADFDPSAYGFDGQTHTYSSSEGNFSDFFNMIFGRDDVGGSGGGFNIGDLFSGGGRKVRQAPRPSYEIEFSLSLEEAYKGGDKTLRLSLNGENKEVNVRWPKGITNGKKIKIKGDKYGINGDILAKVRIVTTDILEGNDIIKTVDVYPWEAYFGTQVIVKTLSGSVRVNIPAKIQSGKKIKVANKGFTDMKNNTGNLYIKVNIVNPTQLSDEQLELYEKLNKLGG